jgi:broad specificity phosphatase PhoE
MIKRLSLLTAALVCNIFFATYAATEQLTENQQMVHAINDGNIELVKSLINKVDVNFRQDGVSLLEMACFKGHKEIATIFVKNGSVVTNYSMVPISEQVALKEKLLASGLEVTSLGTLSYVKNTSKRKLKCADLFFLRHGNTFATENKIFTDIDNNAAFLTPQGKSEIEHITKEIINIKPDVIITSSLTRCKESMSIVLERLESEFEGTIEIREEKSIRGISHGNWEGKNKESLVGEDLLTWFAKWNAYAFARAPEGESLAEILVRAIDFLDFIDEHYPSKKVLVVGHGSFSWALAMLLNVVPDPARNDYYIKYGELKKFA